MDNLTSHDYAKAYGFILDPPKPRAPVESAVSRERYPQRRRVLELEVLRIKKEEYLKAERITIPISYLPKYAVDGGRWPYQVRVKGLYLGGIEKPLRWHSFTDQGIQLRTSLYIGPLPQWVAEKYEAAKRYFPEKRLCVVSRYQPFFKMKESVIQPVATRSPLLLAFDKDDIVYLLAAWGLEYELPQSLGGHLPG